MERNKVLGDKVTDASARCSMDESTYYTLACPDHNYGLCQGGQWVYNTDSTDWTCERYAIEGSNWHLAHMAGIAEHFTVNIINGESYDVDIMGDDGNNTYVVRMDNSIRYCSGSDTLHNCKTDPNTQVGTESRAEMQAMFPVLADHFLQIPSSETHGH